MKENEIRDAGVLDEYLRKVGQDVKSLFDFSSFAYVACPACGSPDHERRFDKTGFFYVSCRRCATLFVNPRPLFDALNRFYSESESTSFWISRFFKPVAEARRVKIFRPRAEYVYNIIESDKQLTIGDIGAGFGLFLEEMCSLMRGSSYVAIEPSLEMAGICREKGLHTLGESLESVSGMDGRFDLLTAFELLEHLYDPRSFLKKVHLLLKPGGRFLMTSLNGMGFDILVLGDKSKSVSPPHHLNFFNPASIRRLLGDAGFDVEEVTTPGKLDWDIVEGMIKSGKADPGRFWNALSREGSDKAKSELQEWISRNDMSSHMRLLAKKA